MQFSCKYSARAQAQCIKSAILLITAARSWTENFKYAFFLIKQIMENRPKLRDCSRDLSAIFPSIHYEKNLSQLFRPRSDSARARKSIRISFHLSEKISWKIFRLYKSNCYNNISFRN